MSKSQAPVEVAIATEGIVVRKAKIGNAYNNLKTYVNENKTTLVIIDGLNPDGDAEFIPISTLKAVFYDNYLRIKLQEACVDYYVEALNERLPEEADEIRRNDVAGVIFRHLLGKMGVKAAYTHHNKGNVWVNKKTSETGSYAQDGWNIDNESIGLSFGKSDTEAYKQYIACNPAYFVDDMLKENDDDFDF